MAVQYFWIWLGYILALFTPFAVRRLREQLPRTTGEADEGWGGFLYRQFTWFFMQLRPYALMFFWSLFLPAVVLFVASQMPTINLDTPEGAVLAGYFGEAILEKIAFVSPVEAAAFQQLHQFEGETPTNESPAPSPEPQ